MKLRVLTLALVPLFAAGCFPDAVVSDETPPAEPTFAPTPTLLPDGGTPPPIDLTGTWAYKSVFTQDVENAFNEDEKDRQTVTSYHILTHTQGNSSTELIHEHQLCLTELSEVSGSDPSLLPGFYPPSASGPINVTLDKAKIGATYSLEETTFLRGVDLANPSADLPTADDPKTKCSQVDSDYMSSDGVYDYDGDGNPGFTTQVVGPVTADLWTIERLKFSLEGTVFSDSTIFGELIGTLEDVFICSTKPGLVSTEVDIEPLTGPDYTFFIMERVDDGMTCSQLISQKDTIFP